MATHSSILALRIPWAEEPGQATTHRSAESADSCTVNEAGLFPSLLKLPALLDTLRDAKKM